MLIIRLPQMLQAVTIDFHFGAFHYRLNTFHWLANFGPSTLDYPRDAALFTLN